MYSKLKYIFPILLVIFLFSFNQVFSHSGRTDSSGGHNCYTGSCAGTYHYHNGGPAYNPPTKPVYVAPTCTKPDLTTITGSPIITEVDCKQNVTFTWDKGVGDNQYSIALSKTAGADPGPTADTTTRSMSFSDVKPGKWYINVKGGNSCGWSNVSYWDIEVPQPNIQINRFSANKRDDGMSELEFDAKCGVSYSISPSVGNLTQAQINQGYVTVKPSEDTTYILTVTGSGQTKKSTVSVLAPTPTPTPVPTVKPTVMPEITTSPSPELSVLEDEITEFIEEEKTDSNQDDSSFFGSLFSGSILSTFLRVLILKF